MKVNLSRGALNLGGDGGNGRVMPLTSPINDLIGLRDEPNYDIHLYSDYFVFWPHDWFEQVSPDLPAPHREAASTPGSKGTEWAETLLGNVGDQSTAWSRARLPRLFLEASRLAESGRYSAKLGPYLERIERRPADATVDVPRGDLPALAAWALDEALRLWPLKLLSCPRCHIPWLTSEDQANPYCLRPAPGLQTSCRTLAREQRYREDQSPWRREYKRLHERTRRGTLNKNDFAAWKADNAPGLQGIDWHPYDEWKT